MEDTVGVPSSERCLAVPLCPGAVPSPCPSSVPRLLDTCRARLPVPSLAGVSGVLSGKPLLLHWLLFLPSHFSLELIVVSLILP